MSPWDYDKNTGELSLLEHDKQEEMKRAIQKSEKIQEREVIAKRVKDLEEVSSKETKEIKSLKKDMERLEKEAQDIVDILWKENQYEIYIGKEKESIKPIIESFIKLHNL